MKISDTKIIGKTFQKIADIVTPTMGAKGQLAVLEDEFGRPYLTDDGVTVAKECLHFKGFEQMVALSISEAASNTERVAFDGTTLTVLLTNEFYKAGMNLIKHHHHSQEAATLIYNDASKALDLLDKQKIKITKSNSKFVRDVANITTKIPVIGELVYQAYQHAGNEMNVIIEHDRKSTESSIEHVDGMVINSGYFSDELRQLCGESGQFVAENAKIILLSEGILTRVGVQTLFGSIEDTTQPLVFVLDRNFNPESLKLLMDMLVQNKLPFMFVFINDQAPEEIFLDIAAKTGGKIQSATLGTTNYKIDYAGTADKIIIEQSKTTIISKGNEEEIKKRLAAYQKEKDDYKYTMGNIRYDIINRRISNLDKGVTKIKLACATVTEYKTIRMKLDDAIGAVRCALHDGVVLGGGKTLYLISSQLKYLGNAFKQPMATIIKNAGFKMPSQHTLEDKTTGLDVQTGKEVDMINAGIIDSYTSVQQAIVNAQSIATSYLKSYILIKNRD